MEDLKELVVSLPRQWLNRALMISLTVISALLMGGFTLGSGWVRGMDARTSRLEERNQKSEIDIARLAVATENLRATVEKAAAERDTDKATRDERARRMDRLLAVLEQQVYNRPKEGSK